MLSDNTTTVKLEINIEGELLSAKSKNYMNFFKWSDLESNENVEETVKGVNAIIKRLDLLEYVTITLTDGAYYNEKIYKSYRFITRWGESKLMEYNEDARQYEESKITIIDQKEYKRIMKKIIIEMFAEMNKIHIRRLQEIIKGKEG